MPLIRIRSLKAGTETETYFDGDYADIFLVHSGDLLIGMDGEFGCYEWNGGPALLNQRVCRLQGFSDDLIPRFLYYGVNGYLKAIEDVTGFTTVKHLSSKQILGIEFPLPPLPEQKRIVAILDEAFDGIASAVAATEQNLVNARELFESRLNNVFTQRSSGWLDIRLEDLCVQITVGHVGSMAARYKNAGVPFLRSQNVRPFEVNFSNLRFIDDEFNIELKKSVLGPGDVVIVRTGYPGTAAVIPQNLPVANCSDLVIVRPKPDTSPDYIALFLNSQFGKQLVGSKLVGAAQKHFNVSAAKGVSVPIPNLEEQNRISVEIDSFRATIRGLESTYQLKIDTLTELKQSILQKAFAGELTAEPDKALAAAGL